MATHWDRERPACIERDIRLCDERDYRSGFSELRRIIEYNHISPSAGVKHSAMKHTVSRTNEIISVIVLEKYATYYDLAHKYTIEEFLDLLEIVMVDMYNKAIDLEVM